MKQTFQSQLNRSSLFLVIFQLEKEQFAQRLTTAIHVDTITSETWEEL